MSTVIQKLIDTSLMLHKEPERKGTPKGESIGFSKIKLKAALLTTLYNYEAIKIADLTSISYGLLRKWKTEEEFKKLCKNILDSAFDAAIWPAILQISNPIEINMQISQIDSHIPDEATYSVDTKPFEDAKFYSDNLRHEILHNLPSKIELLDPILMLLIYRLVDYFFTQWESPRGDKFEKNIKNIIYNRIITFVTNVLKINNSSEYEKHKAVWLMINLRLCI